MEKLRLPGHSPRAEQNSAGDLHIEWAGWKVRNAKPGINFLFTGGFGGGTTTAPAGLSGIR
jgi:hypothetical protein